MLHHNVGTYVGMDDPFNPNSVVSLSSNIGVSNDRHRLWLGE